MTVQLDHIEQLYEAVYRAVEVGERTQRALYAATCSGAIGCDVYARAAAIGRRIARHEIFSDDDASDMRELAIALHELARAETQIGYEHDEHNMSGGHTTTHATERGVALNDARARLLELATAVDEVRHRLVAEKILERILT